MSVFIGGSAYGMAQSIADGYIVTTELVFKKFPDSDLRTFLVEADRLLREIRGNQAATDDAPGTRTRQVRIHRVQQAITIANTVRRKRR